MAMQPFDMTAAQWADACTLARKAASAFDDFEGVGNVVYVTNEDGQKFALTVEPVEVTP